MGQMTLWTYEGIQLDYAWLCILSWACRETRTIYSPEIDHKLVAEVVAAI